MSKPFKIRRWLVPAGWVFGNVARLRRKLYEKGVLQSYKPQIPVICVGNIAIGGTGKTPHAGYLMELLSKHHHVAMLSRGYGRKSRGYVLANTTPTEKLSADLIGDEPLLLHYRFPKLPLAVDGDRREGVIKLCEYAPDTDVVVMDDAYQHLNFSPTVRLVLTEFRRPYFKDYPMPAGRLREFPDAVSVADAVIVTKVDAPNDEVDRDEWRRNLKIRNDQPLFFTHYRYASPEPVTEAANLQMLENSKVVLLTGIARPLPLLEHLQQHYDVCQHLDFPDHHPYNKFELEQINRIVMSGKGEKRVLFTTEKDWMRLQAQKLQKDVSLLPVFIVPIQVDFLSESEKLEFNNLIENHVRRIKK